MRIYINNVCESERKAACRPKGQLSSERTKESRMCERARALVTKPVVRVCDADETIRKPRYNTAALCFGPFLLRNEQMKLKMLFDISY